MAKPDEASITIRLPRDLHQRIVDLANGERRSLNNYFIVALEQHADLAEAAKKGKPNA